MNFLDKLSDDELIKRFIAESNQTDFATLVKRHQTRLRLYLRGLCGNQAMADELAQDTFLKVYLSINQFKNQSSFKTWLITIARNTYFDQGRLKKIKNHSEILTPELQNDSISQIYEEQFKQSHGNEMLSIDIEMAIDLLSENEKMVILHCYFADLTMAETAELLKMPIGSVKSHSSRALYKMSQTLSDWRKG